MVNLLNVVHFKRNKLQNLVSKKTKTKKKKCMNGNS